MIAAITSDQIWGFELFFSIFALCMLPFASVFLSARLRARLGLKMVVLSLLVLLVVIPAGLVLALPSLLKSSFDRFVEKDQNYYSELAGVCEQVMSNRAGSWILAGNDASLPKPIRDLHATEVECMRHLSGTNEVSCLYITIGVSRSGYVIGWGLNDYGDGNQQWELSVGGDGERKILFSKKKS